MKFIKLMTLVLCGIAFNTVVFASEEEQFNEDKKEFYRTYLNIYQLTEKEREEESVTIKDAFEVVETNNLIKQISNYNQQKHKDLEKLTKTFCSENKKIQLSDISTKLLKLLNITEILQNLRGDCRLEDGLNTLKTLLKKNNNSSKITQSKEAETNEKKPQIKKSLKDKVKELKVKRLKSKLKAYNQAQHENLGKVIAVFFPNKKEAQLTVLKNKLNSLLDTIQMLNRLCDIHSTQDPLNASTLLLNKRKTLTRVFFDKAIAPNNKQETLVSLLEALQKDLNISLKNNRLVKKTNSNEAISEKNKASNNANSSETEEEIHQQDPKDSNFSDKKNN